MLLDDAVIAADGDELAVAEAVLLLEYQMRVASDVGVLIPDGDRVLTLEMLPDTVAVGEVAADLELLEEGVGAAVIPGHSAYTEEAGGPAPGQEVNTVPAPPGEVAH